MTPRALRGMAVNEVGRARISMMVRSMSSNSRPDTLVQDRTPQPHRFLLQRTAGPYIGVKHFQAIHRRSVGSRARASLRNRQQGPSIMGFEDKAEQSVGRPCRQTNGGSKRPANSPHRSSREGRLSRLSGVRPVKIDVHGPMSDVGRPLKIIPGLKLTTDHFQCARLNYVIRTGRGPASTGRLLRQMSETLEPWYSI